MLKSFVVMLSLLLCDSEPSSSWIPNSNWDHQIFFSSATSPKALHFQQFAPRSSHRCVCEGSLAPGTALSAGSCVSRTAEEPLKFTAHGCGISKWETGKEVLLVF